MFQSSPTLDDYRDLHARQMRVWDRLNRGEVTKEEADRTFERLEREEAELNRRLCAR